MPYNKLLYLKKNKKHTDDITSNRIFNLIVNRNNNDNKLSEIIKSTKNISVIDSKNNKIKVIVKPRVQSIVNLNNKFPPVYDQGILGSCTACALAGMIYYFHSSLKSSRLFIYYNERKLDNTIPDDVGSTLQNGIECLKKYGACQENEWPYIINKFAIKPPKKCYIYAKKHLVTQAKNIDETFLNMKSFITRGYPFVVGILIYQSFMSNYVSLTGNVPMPDINNEILLGGHAVICIGYNDNTKQWIMRNSWSKKWGVNGNFYLPYSYLLDPKLAGDMWTIININCNDNHN